MRTKLAVSQKTCIGSSVGVVWRSNRSPVTPCLMSMGVVSNMLTLLNQLTSFYVHRMISPRL